MESVMDFCFADSFFVLLKKVQIRQKKCIKVVVVQ